MVRVKSGYRQAKSIQIAGFDAFRQALSGFYMLRMRKHICFSLGLRLRLMCTEHNARRLISLWHLLFTLFDIKYVNFFK